jgi:hypothetical protein
MTIYNPFWWIRKKHAEDYEQAFKDSGCEKEQFVLRHYNGEEFRKAFRALGHTAIQLEQCECWKKRKETECPYKEDEECFRKLSDCSLCPDRRMD